MDEKLKSMPLLKANLLHAHLLSRKKWRMATELNKLISEAIVKGRSGIKAPIHILSKVSWPNGLKKAKKLNVGW